MRLGDFFKIVSELPEETELGIDAGPREEVRVVFKDGKISEIILIQ